RSFLGFPGALSTPLGLHPLYGRRDWGKMEGPHRSDRSIDTKPSQHILSSLPQQTHSVLPLFTSSRCFCICSNLFPVAMGIIYLTEAS
ncbi:mCG144550, partial [Mus musculus]